MPVCAVAVCQPVKRLQAQGFGIGLYRFPHQVLLYQGQTALNPKIRILRILGQLLIQIQDLLRQFNVGSYRVCYLILTAYHIIHPPINKLIIIILPWVTAPTFLWLCLVQIYHDYILHRVPGKMNGKSFGIV